ncbi:MAG: hypothetical protein H7Y01_07700, partial [Ferruginibacter sp.]|nr:hypothetical protein [Chitinophagaceae bacterium]
PGDSLYIVLAFISALLGGFIGIIAGVVYNRSKRNGYYFYDKKTREKGGLMIIIGAFVLTGTIIWRVG